MIRAELMRADFQCRMDFISSDFMGIEEECEDAIEMGRSPSPGLFNGLKSFLGRRRRGSMNSQKSSTSESSTSGSSDDIASSTEGLASSRYNQNYQSNPELPIAQGVRRRAYSLEGPAHKLSLPVCLPPVIEEPEAVEEKRPRSKSDAAVRSYSFRDDINSLKTSSDLFSALITLI